MSKEIYRKINAILPDLRTMPPFTKVDLSNKGFSGMQVVILDCKPDDITFIFTRYENERGHLIANPSIEISVNLEEKTANVKTYKDPDYFHTAVAEPSEIGEIALCQANNFLLDLLNNLSNRPRKHGTRKTQHFTR